MPGCRLSLLPEERMAVLAGQFAELGLVCWTDAELAPFLTLRIGGRAGLLAEIQERSIWPEVLSRAAALEIPLVILGGGSNVFFSDGPVQAAVLLDRTSGIELLEPGTLRVQSGTRIAELTAWCLRRGIGGLEFLAGIPGTLGGACAVNAGAFGSSMAELVQAVEICDEKGFRELGRGDCAFSYRASRFKYGSELISSVKLSCHSAPPEETAGLTRKYLDYRRLNHPSYALATAGCYFKNPVNQPGRSAGCLLEECGLKGRARGNLSLAEKHANFLVNLGGAGSSELLAWEAETVGMVEAETGIRLQREVIYIDSAGCKS